MKLQKERLMRKILVIIVIILLTFSIFPVIPVQAEESREEDGAVFFTGEISDSVIDTNEDEMFDFLIMEVTIGVDVQGTYELSGKLIVGDDKPVMYVCKEFETEERAANITLKLKFAGKPIYDTGVSGHYFCVLWLNDQTGKTIDELEYRTKEYVYSEFQHPPPPIKITDHFEDLGTDLDRDGSYDLLTIKIGVDVLEPGYYLLLGGLFKKLEDGMDDVNVDDDHDHAPYFLITGNRITVDLNEKSEYIELDFKGPAIRLSGFNGPYFIGLWLEQVTQLEEKERINERLLWPMAGKSDLSGRVIFKTEDYLYSDFEEPFKIVKFTDRVKDYPVDTNENKLFEFLRLSMTVNVTEAGKYLIRGRIFTGSDWFDLIAENITYLEPGMQQVVINFKGPDIHKNRLEGILDIHLLIKGESSEGFQVFDEMKYSTYKKYRYTDFESTYDRKEMIDISNEPLPYAKLDMEGITTKTDIMEVYTTRTRPEISFWYSDTDHTNARFKLIYHRLIGYSDHNQNGIFDFGEERFDINLEDSLWMLNGLTYSVNSRYGNYVEFQLSTEVSIDNIDQPLSNNPDDPEHLPPPPPTTHTRKSTSTNTRQELEDPEPPRFEEEPFEFDEPKVTYPWARIDFKFLITSNDFTLTEYLDVKINGGTELKIDVNIEFYKYVDIDGICLEQILFDEAKIFGFKTKETNQDRTFQPNEPEQGPENHKDMELEPMHLFEPREGDIKQLIMFIDDSEKEYGFYSWVNKVNITYSNGQSKLVSINSSYVIDGTVLRLFTNYPYDNDLSTIHHEPSIGMVKESKPKRSEPIDEIAQILFNPAIYIIACIVALISLAVLRKSQMQKEQTVARVRQKPMEKQIVRKPVRIKEIRK